MMVKEHLRNREDVDNEGEHTLCGRYRLVADQIENPCG